MTQEHRNHKLSCAARIKATSCRQGPAEICDGAATQPASVESPYLLVSNCPAGATENHTFRPSTNTSKKAGEVIATFLTILSTFPDSQSKVLKGSQT